jgi:L-iditol 2-dehydrogenase
MVYAGVLHGIDDIQYQDINISELKEDEVLINVKCAGICGSDIPRIKTKGTYHFPTIPGHEFSGIIVKKGHFVENVIVGDKVTIYPLIPCKKCFYCQAGKENLCKNYDYLGSRCNGGFAEYVKCPASNVLKIPEEVNFEEAALVEPIAVALRGVKRGKVKLGDKVIVFGMGPIGIFSAQWAKIMGAKVVVGIDRNDHKLEIAKKVGITHTINSNNENYTEKIKERLNGNADVILECSGANVFQEKSLELVKKSGIISIIGNPKQDMIIKENLFQLILRKEITLIGCWNSLITVEENEWKLVLNALKTKKIKVAPIITHRFNLPEIKSVFDNLYAQKYKDYCKGVFLINENV